MDQDRETTPTEELNDAVEEAAKYIAEQIKIVKLRIDILNEQVRLLTEIYHTLSELQTRLQPSGFEKIMSAIRTAPAGTREEAKRDA